MKEQKQTNEPKDQEPSGQCKRIRKRSWQSKHGAGVHNGPGSPSKELVSDPLPCYKQGSPSKELVSVKVLAVQTWSQVCQSPMPLDKNPRVNVDTARSMCTGHGAPPIFSW